jgi:hypothetical protein
MYLADSIGYLGYAVLMLAKNAFPAGESFLVYFTHLADWIFGIGLIALLLALLFYARALPREQPAAGVDPLSPALAGE